MLRVAQVRSPLHDLVGLLLHRPIITLTNASPPSAIVLLLAGGIPATLGTAFGLTMNPSLDVALQQCRTVGYLLYQVAFVFTFPMLLDAALAVLYDWELIESSAPLVQTIAYSFVGVEVVFAIVVFIFVESSGIDYATLNSSLAGGVLPYVRLLATFDVFLWMASVGMAFYSAFLVLLARRRPTHHKVKVGPIPVVWDGSGRRC